MTRTITIDQLEFIVAPDPVQVPEPMPSPEPVPPTTPVETPKTEPQTRQIKQPSTPQCSANRCTMSSSKRGPDGLYHMNYIADQMWAKKNKRWWQR